MWASFVDKLNEIDIAELLKIENGFAFLALCLAVYLVAKVVGRKKQDTDGILRSVGDITITIIFLLLVFGSLIVIYTPPTTHEETQTVKLEVNVEAVGREGKDIKLRVRHAGSNGSVKELKIDDTEYFLLKNSNEYLILNLGHFFKEIENLEIERTKLLDNIEKNLKAKSQNAVFSGESDG